MGASYAFCKPATHMQHNVPPALYEERTNGPLATYLQHHSMSTMQVGNLARNSLLEAHSIRNHFPLVERLRCDGFLHFHVPSTAEQNNVAIKIVRVRSLLLSGWTPNKLYLGRKYCPKVTTSTSASRSACNVAFT